MQRWLFYLLILLLYLANTVFADAKVEFEYLSSSPVYVNETGKMQICLFNHGDYDVDLVTTDYIEITLPYGTDENDLLYNASGVYTGLICSAPTDWSCSLTIDTDYIELEISPDTTFEVDNGDSICFEIDLDDSVNTVTYNAAEGMATLFVYQQIGTNHSRDPVNTAINIFKIDPADITIGDTGPTAMSADYEWTFSTEKITIKINDDSCGCYITSLHTKNGLAGSQ